MRWRFLLASYMLHFSLMVPAFYLLGENALLNTIRLVTTSSVAGYQSMITSNIGIRSDRFKDSLMAVNGISLLLISIGIAIAILIDDSVADKSTQIILFYPWWWLYFVIIFGYFNSNFARVENILLSYGIVFFSSFAYNCPDSYVLYRIMGKWLKTMSSISRLCDGRFHIVRISIRDLDRHEDQF